MEMKQYLVDTWRYNDKANKQVLEKIRLLPDKAEAIKFFSHLINSQEKWLERIQIYPVASKRDWWEPVYELSELESRWTASTNAWVKFIEAKTEQDLFEEVRFVGYDGAQWAALLKDIALQLNYHSIHHRAQIQTMVRQQGLEPDFVDYIGTAYRKLN